jgi:hypothetical protein
MGKNIESQITTRKALFRIFRLQLRRIKLWDLAADEMFNDKQWRKFLEPDATPDDFTDEAWSLFQEELNRRSEEILRKRKLSNASPLQKFLVHRNGLAALETQGGVKKKGLPPKSC